MYKFCGYIVLNSSELVVVHFLVQAVTPWVQLVSELQTSPGVPYTQGWLQYDAVPVAKFKKKKTVAVFIFKLGKQ